MNHAGLLRQSRFLWFCGGLVVALWRFCGFVAVMWRFCCDFVAILWRASYGLVAILWRLRGFRELLCVATATVWSGFWKLQHSPRSFLCYNCQQNFLCSRNYSTNPEVSYVTTAIKFSSFREITVPTHNSLLLQLPTHQLSSINFTGTLTCFHTLQLPFLSITQKLWQS